MNQYKFKAYNKSKKIFEEVSLKNDDNVTFLQFIGLQDKSGRDIYEGDILNFNHFNGRMLKEIKGAEVWYNENDCMWCFGRFKSEINTDYWYLLLDCIDKKSMEIVGNIYGQT